MSFIEGKINRALGAGGRTSPQCAATQAREKPKTASNHPVQVQLDQIYNFPCSVYSIIE